MKKVAAAVLTAYLVIPGSTAMLLAAATLVATAATADANLYDLQCYVSGGEIQETKWGTPICVYP